MSSNAYIWRQSIPSSRLQIPQLPIRFKSGHQSHALDSIESFIHVPNEVQRSLEAGSSWNIQEVDAIDRAILKLVSFGSRQEDIAVITRWCLLGMRV